MIGDGIKKILDEKSMTAYELAKKGEISNSYLSEILSNKKNNPSMNVLMKIATALDTDVNDLIIKGQE